MSQMGRLHFLFTEYQRLRSEFSSIANQTSETSLTLATGDDYTTNAYTFKAAPGTGSSFYITRIVFAITTAVHTKNLQFFVGATLIATLLGTKDPAGAADVVGENSIDFGPDGFKCPANGALTMKNSATGLAGSIFVMGYSRVNPTQ